MKNNSANRLLVLALLSAFSSLDSRAANEVNVVQFLNPSKDYDGPRTPFKCELKSFNRLPDINDASKTKSISITCGTFPPQSVWVQLTTPDAAPFKNGSSYDADSLDRYVSLSSTDGMWKSKSGKIKIEKVSGDGKTIRVSFKTLLQGRFGPATVTAEGVIEGTASN
jgi:hypothetical protein